MDLALETIWVTIQNRLEPNRNILNWTALKGYLGDSMQIMQVTTDEVVVRAPNAKNLQHIHRDEFEKVFDVWSAYKSGKKQRQEIREMTYHSKYIISILHSLEEKSP